MEEFQNALEGKVTTDDWTAEKLVEYHKFLKETTDKEKGEVGGLREAKRAEAERVQKLKDEAARAEEQARSAAPGPKIDPALKPFRDEQVEKAKQKLFSTVKLTDEEKATVEEKFKRLDTGKLDADFIYKDYLSSLAAANPDKFLALTQSHEEMQRNAEAELERQAAAGNAAPSGDEKKKYSQDALDLSKKAGITPEAATRQISEGMTRIIG